MCNYTQWKVQTFLIQLQPFGSYVVLILVTQIIAVASIYTYDIASAVEISVSYDMIPHNISAWHDISMMGYDARMVYYCNESIWYQDNIYIYIYISVLYDVSEWYDISVWHDTTAVWYDIPSQAWVAGIIGPTLAK